MNNKDRIVDGYNSLNRNVVPSEIQEIEEAPGF
jgi:hypothetical protein